MAEAVPEIMTIHDCSLYLGISEDTVYKYAAQGKLPAFKLGNRWRFKKSLLDHWIEQQCQSVQLETNV